MMSYFNLRTTPFAHNLAADQLFAFAAFAEGQKRLEYLKETRGIMLLTGEPGSGKTTLIRAFAASLNPQYFQTYYIPLSTVTPLEFYRQLHYELTGFNLHRRVDLFRSIQKSVRDFVENRKIIPVFFFDEVHFMKNNNFFELQLILNFEYDSINPVIVVLIGQSHLRERLSQNFFSAFNRRILVKHHQAAMCFAETKSFVYQQMAQVNAPESLFADDAIEAIHNLSHGLPGLIAKLSNHSLTAAYLAKKSFVSAEEVRLAAQEM